MELFNSQDNGVAFDLILQPRSSFVKLVGIHGDALKLRVCSPPVDNKANLECQRYFSKIFSVPKTDIHIIQGQKTRRKRIFIRNLDPKRAKQIVDEHLV